MTKMFNPQFSENKVFIGNLESIVITEDKCTWDRKIIEKIWNWYSITFIPGEMIRVYMKDRVKNTLES